MRDVGLNALGELTTVGKSGTLMSRQPNAHRSSMKDAGATPTDMIASGSVKNFAIHAVSHISTVFFQ